MLASAQWTNCPACGRLSVRVETDGVGAKCTGCAVPVRSVVFPALIPKAPPPPPLPGDVPGEGEMACYYSPQRRATTTCAQCGVFISEAWSAKWGARILCLRCLEKLKDSGKSAQFESQRVLWDNIVLLLALAPLCLIFWWVGFLTAPAALVLGIWAWKKPASLVPRGKARLVIGMALALFQIIGMVVLFYNIFAQIGHH